MRPVIDRVAPRRSQDEGLVCQSLLKRPVTQVKVNSNSAFSKVVQEFGDRKVFKAVESRLPINEA